MPDTVMARAFLAALRHWLAAHRLGSSQQIAIPTGRVDADELARVLCAISTSTTEEKPDANRSSDFFEDTQVSTASHG